MTRDRGQGRAACALECLLLRLDGEKAREIELRSGVILKSHSPIGPTESHTNKLHKYFL